MSYLLILMKAIPVAFAALLPVFNPIGTTLILLGMTEGASVVTRRALAKKIAINTIVLTTVILLVGSYVLSFFGITVPVVQVAGGFVLASMGWKLLNQTNGSTHPGEPLKPKEDPSIYFSRTFYPYTFPVTIGPGGVAVTLTLSAHNSRGVTMDTLLGQSGAFIGIVGVTIVTYLCFAYSNRLFAKLGPSGTAALMRLIAFIVVCIGAEISWSGIRALILQLPHH